MTGTDPQHPAQAVPPDVPNVHVAGRALPTLLILWTLGSVLVAGLSVPSISARVGLDRTDGVWATGTFLVVSSLAFLAHHRFGTRSSVGGV